MKWTTTKLQQPENAQEVFICTEGTVYEAVFNTLEKCFILKNSTRPRLCVEGKLIFWKDKKED